jgi:hypothetical protein
MLVAVPLRDQLDEKTTDGAPDENARANCVPASLAAALSALTGRDYEGDELKDAVYGQGYTGATDPARYVAYAAAQGVRMWEMDGSGAWMVAAIAVELARGHPVYGAIPSQWGNTTAADIAAHGGPTHAVMFCDASPGGATLTAMNPWPVDGRSAFYQTMPSAWWATRLVYGHIYPMERTMLQITDVAAFFTAQDDTHWTCRQNGHTLALGMLAACWAASPRWACRWATRSICWRAPACSASSAACWCGTPIVSWTARRAPADPSTWRIWRAAPARTRAWPRCRRNWTRRGTAPPAPARPSRPSTRSALPSPRTPGRRRRGVGYPALAASRRAKM